MKKPVFKVLAIADPHMSNRLPYSRPMKNDVTDRLEDQMKIWEHVRETVRKEAVDAVFVLGDLFDKSLVDAVTLTHTVSAIMSLDCDVHILPGNHDANSIRGGRFTVEAFGAMKRDNVQVMGEKPGERLEIIPGRWTYWPVAFKPVEAMEQEIEAIQSKMNPVRRNVLLLHGSVLGASHMGWECDEGLEPDSICEGFELVLAGHFHRHQEFGPNGMYLGSPMHHHYGDVGNDAGYWLFEFGKKGQIEKTFVDPGAPKFHLRKSLGDAIDVSPGDYLRYELEATHAQWSKLKLQAQEICQGLEKKGIRTDVCHKPIYHHKSRLLEDKAGVGAMSMGKAVAEYTRAAGVDTAGLSKKKLKKIGLAALEEARSTHGFD